MWELHVQIWGVEEAGPSPAAVDGFVCVLTAMAAGLVILALIALWQWFWEKRGGAEDT